MTKKEDIAAFIGLRIDTSGKTQTEIAEEIGIEQNFLSMIRNGKAKIPIGRILALADALEVDRADFVRRVLDAFQPDLWATLTSVFLALTFTEEEVDLLMKIRAARAIPLPRGSLTLAPGPIRKARPPRKQEPPSGKQSAKNSVR